MDAIDAVGTNIRDTDTAVDASGDHLYDWLIAFDEPMGFTWNPYTDIPGTQLVGSVTINGGVTIH